MSEQQPHSPLLYSYLKKYQDNPGSRVFAPLAEAYRKAGLIEEAIEIAKEGLENHPDFVGGKVALARAFSDKGEHKEVVDILQPVVRDVPDNIVAQRLFAESSLVLGRITDALGSYKLLLYFNPTDKDVAKLVWELESKAYQDGALILSEPMAENVEGSVDPQKATAGFRISPLENVIGEDPEWIRKKWVRKIERLQRFLQNIERYKRKITE